MVRIIKDCIYRFIEVPKVCQKFMDHPLFQRLRRIRQLGLAHYVYPSAVHTRFEHSLGVMHLSGVVIDHLSKFEEITTREKELVQLAGMLHDVGHLAYSHLFDLLFEIIGKNETHEQRSIQFFHRMNNELKELSLEEERLVSDMILGKNNHPKPYLFEIVCNSRNGLDVDKMDYLQRDAYHTGLPGFQPDYLIRNMRIQEGHIAFRDKVREDVKDLYLTRKRMFYKVYYHKTINKIERIYICMLLRCYERNATQDILDDFRVETILRDLYRYSFSKLDSRDFSHSCEICRNFHLDKTPSLNGHISGDGKIRYT